MKMQNVIKKRGKCKRRLQFTIGNYNKGAISLIEIIIIVTVLSILAAASIVSYQGAKQRAQIRRSCAALHNIVSCMQNYWYERDYYPLTATITKFEDLYTQLSAVGLDANPEKEFKAFVLYDREPEDTYTLVVRAADMRGTLLTATPNGIIAHDGDRDHSELCKQ